MKYFIVILTIIELFGYKLFCQNFAPINAVWHYTYNPLPALTFGYYKIEVEKDTIIDNKICSKLNCSSIGYDFWNHCYYNYFEGVEFICSDSNKVNWYHNNQFYTLYDFNANIGDYWYIPNYDDYGNGIGKIIVDSISQTIINFDTLKVIYQHTDSGNVSFGDFQIIEKIGDVSFLFPFYSDITGPEFPGPLRCYNDNQFGLFHNSGNPDCDYITFNDLLINQNFDINVYPNPSKGIVNVAYKMKASTEVSVEVYNMLGEIVYKSNKQSSKEGTISIDLKEGIEGVYTFRIKVGESFIQKKVVLMKMQ